MSDHEIPILDDNKQVERFVLELTVSEGRVDHARIEHPRTGATRFIDDWPEGQVTAFVTAHARLTDLSTPPAGAESTTGAPSTARIEPMTVDIDGGHLIGGSKKPTAVFVTLPPSRPSDPPGLIAYRVTAFARPFGAGRRAEIGCFDGLGRGGERVELELDASDLIRGLHRVDLHLETAAPGSN